MDSSKPPGMSTEEEAKWDAAANRKRRAGNPLTVRQVSTDPTTGATTATFHQEGKPDPIWTTTIAPEQPKWSLKNEIKRRITPTPPKP